MVDCPHCGERVQQRIVILENGTRKSHCNVCNGLLSIERGHPIRKRGET
jgi:hypothetical protein